MAHPLDAVPFSGIIRIRDLMYSVVDPFRLDQGDVSFDAPDTLKDALIRAVHDNRTHYLQTTGLPRLRELLAEKMRAKNGIPVGNPDEVMVTNGGIHALFVVVNALLTDGDEVIVPDPEWPPAIGNIMTARAVPVACPLREASGWRWDLDELARRITPRTRAIYINSPGNPTGGVFTREDLEGIARLAERHGLWIISDEAYEDVVYDGAEHVSVASFPGLYARTIPIYTFSKTYAITGLRLGYFATGDPDVAARARKMLLYTAGNVSSVVQYAGIGALEGSQASTALFREELQARRDLFYAGIHAAAPGVFSGQPPKGAFYAFLRVDPAWRDPSSAQPSQSWAMTEYLIRHARIGSVPGADFGRTGEGHVRFCFARDRKELTGALESMRAVFAASSLRRGAAPRPL
jgi:aspartate aminotransferase